MHKIITKFFYLSDHKNCDFQLPIVLVRQWLFCRRRQFAFGIYFAVIIHVCLYSQIGYNYTSDTAV